jgi:uncharacterized protein (TIGR03437 family)
MGVSIPVSLAVGAAAATTVSVSPPSLEFNAVAGSGPPAAQTLQVAAAGGAATAFTASAGAAWPAVSPTAGITPASETVSVTGNLAAGSYSTTISIVSAGGAVTVPVSLTVASAPTATISANPSSLTFAVSAGSNAPVTQTVQLTASGGAALAFATAASSAGNWLAVTPASGSTPATLTVSVSPTGLAAGSYNGAVTVNGGAVTIAVMLTVPTPLATIAGVVNAASFATGAVSPGEMISIVGTNLGPANPAYLTLNSNGYVATSIGGVTVSIGGTLAPLVYVSSNQINAIVPYETIGLMAPTVLVEYQGLSSNGFTVQTAVTAPGIFTQTASGSGPGAILNQDYTLNGPGNPAARGSTAIVYVTGEGQTLPGGVDGKVTVANISGVGPVTPAPLLQVSATIGGEPALVEFAGEAPGMVSGVLQVNVQIPADAATGNLPVAVTVGNASSQSGVTVSVQ